MALENVRGVVFDAFGTLVDIGERRRPYLRLMKLAAAAGRRPQPDDAAKIMSMNCDIFGVADWLGVEVSDALRAEIEADLAVELGSISLFSDALPLINFLRSQGIKVAVCSNLAQPYATAVRALLQDLDAYIFSFEVGAVKPDDRLFREAKFGTAQPAMTMYQAACEKLGLPPDQILMVGDSFTADFWGPRKFGMSARHLARHGRSPDVDAIASLSDLLAVESEQPGWQECIDDQTGKRTWIPMSLSQTYHRQQMAARGLLSEADEEVLKAFSTGSMSKAEAMRALNFKCIEQLFSATVAAGFGLPRQSREVALEEAKATTDFVKRKMQP